ncbi:MAG: regulatory protein RecX [Candidatus Altimarinota bacterium]
MKALEYAIRSLLRKRQTEQEIRERIKKRHPDAKVEEVISRLKELNYINDAEFSEAWIRHRTLSSPKGKFKLEQELKLKGVSGTNRQKALEEYDEKAVLEEIAQKKWQQLTKHFAAEGQFPLSRGSGGEGSRKTREKLMRYLLSRGFAISSVLEVVKTVAHSEENG